MRTDKRVTRQRFFDFHFSPNQSPEFIAARLLGVPSHTIFALTGRTRQNSRRLTKKQARRLRTLLGYWCEDLETDPHMDALLPHQRRFIRSVIRYIRGILDHAQYRDRDQDQDQDS